MLSLCAATGLLVNTAKAQTGPSTPPPAAAATTDDTMKLEAFQVTGSYLPVSASVTASPVVTIQSSDIGQSGATDPIRLLRQLTPFFAGSGNVGTEANNGAGGESNVALRNLSTLVLINGQRLVSSPFSSGTAVDLNTIPVAMIERIEILKDGASTVYGTDAIGGVVNVILKKDYNGFEAGAKWGQTANGDYRTKDVYIIGGAAGAGYSLTVAAEHFENNTLKTTSRSIATLTPAQENALGYEVTSSVYSGTYPGRINSDVLAGSTLIAIGAPGFNPAITSLGIKSSPNATPVTVAQLEAAGILIPVNTTPAGKAVGSATALNTTLFGNPLITPTRRNQFVSNGEKELFGKNLVVYGDFLYADTINSGSTLAPAPIAGVGPAGANSLTIPANNPYNVFSVAFPGSIAARTRTIELGPRTSNIETNTYRFVGGLKGDINENYSWDVSYSYSHASMLDRTLGGGNGANMNEAMIPELNAAGGYVYNAAGKPLSMLTDASGNNVPVYNFFALPGFNDPATLALLKTTLFDSGATGLHDVRALIRGTPFELPAGPLGFDVGVEERSESITSSVDGLYSNGLALGFNTANTFAGGSRSSKGAFAEVDVPLTSAKNNITGLHVVDLTLADREEKIKPGGTANSPKIGLRWLPFDDQFALRATASKGFIAPSIVDLFGPAVGNSPTFQILQSNPAAGGPGAGGSIAGAYQTIQGTATQLSNPNLQASTSKSFTAGFVFSPKAIKGLSLTVDYYKISQDKIGGLDYTAIVADLNAKGSGSVYAPGFLFADNSKLTSTAPNQLNAVNFGSITVQNSPTGDQWTNGLDIDLSYKFSTEVAGQWGVGVSANYLFNYIARNDSSAPYYQYARNYTDGTTGIGQANGLLPGYILKPYINNVYGPLSTSLFFNYVPRTTVSGSLFGDFTPGDTNNETVSGKAATIPSYFTTDIAFTYAVPNFGKNWARGISVTVGANNLFGKNPPYVPVDGNPPGENNTVESTYDIIGRFMFVELKKAF